MSTFLKDTIERAVATAAQTALALVPVAIHVSDVDWAQVGGVALTAAGLSVLKSIAARRVGNPEDASLVF